MNEVLKRSFLLVAMVVFLFHMSTIMPSISFGKPTQNSQIIVSTKLQNVTQADIERVKREAEIALDSIPAVLGINRYKRDIKIKIMEKGPCMTTRDKIVLLGAWFVQNKRAPIVHEVAHVVADKHKGNKFFNEGLAEFLQDKFGEDAGGITYYKERQSLSLDDLVIKYKDSLISLYHLKHNNGVFGLRNKSANRKIAYIEAASFIKFLYEKYGEHKLRDLYHSRNLDYEKVYGKGINELEGEWLNYVFIELPDKNPKTQYQMGLFEKNVDDAIYWFSLAAKNGYVDAQKKLGDMYKEGQQVTQNYSEAIKWYTMAAHQGDTISQRKLGLCYIESDENYINAYAWLTMAADQGSKMSKRRRDKISKMMTPEQIAAAEEIIKEIKAK